MSRDGKGAQGSAAAGAAPGTPPSGKPIPRGSVSAGAASGGASPEAPVPGGASLEGAAPGSAVFENAAPGRATGGRPFHGDRHARVRSASAARTRAVFLGAFLVFAIAFLFALCAGHVWSSPAEALRSIFGEGREKANLIYLWRLPRAVTAAAVGALLGLSGAVFQGIFRNPLAEPWLVGSSGGAAVGATLALLLPWPVSQEIVLPSLSFAGALGAAFLVLALARLSGSLDTATLLLAGIAVSAILTALRSFLMMTLSSDNLSLQVVMSWLMGSIQAPDGTRMTVFLCLSALVFALSLLMARPLDLLGLGESMAAAWGLNVRRAVVLGLILGSAAAALAVSAGGMVAFVGLAAPHVGRFLVGTRHRRLIPFSALAGAVLVTAADALARSLLPPGEIPLGLLTALAGGPFFLVLLAGRNRAT
ncbi:MAG: iron ABC transporter permease [Deltaproteobacteria bacterium]|jgi:iron complex transport system permease protein|nr:iron ABC transporter permease [Deltaproteobacteria bacterium]